MAGSRRMSPAELKARLQANLAVAGVKSSDPSPIAAAASGEKPQIASEALGSAPVPLEKFSAPTAQTKAHRPSTEEQKAPEGHQNQSFGTQTDTQISAGLTAVNSISETRGNQANWGASNHETSNPETPNAEPSNLVQAVPGSPAATASLQQQQNVSSFSLGQSTEAKRSGTPPAPDRDFAGAPGAQAGKNLGSLADSQRQNETANIAATTREPRTESAPTVAPAPAVTQARKRAQATPPTVAKRADRTVLHRRDQGAVLRGYRIPVELHRQAERAKLGLASRRGSSLFWDELLQGAIDLLLDDIHRISNELSAARRTPEMGTPNTRVLQAAIRHDQDLRLRMLRIDLEELDGATVRLEEIWTWLIRQVVKNEG
jgi:hypothetical protein